MKLKLTTAVAAALALGCTAASAQSGQNFIGPAIGVSVGAQNSKTSLSSSVVPNVDGRAPEGNDSAVSLLGSWGYAVSDKWVATVGISWDLKSTDAGQLTYTTVGGISRSATIKTKEHLSLSIAPGYRLSPSSLLYGKLAYHQLKGDYSDTAANLNTISASPDYNGPGVGLGLATMITPSLQLRGEFEMVQYNEKDLGNSRAKPTQNLFSLGLLYKF